MDQSPLAFEFLKGRTYNKRGEKTVLLKGANISAPQSALLLLCHVRLVNFCLRLCIGFVEHSSNLTLNCILLVVFSSDTSSTP
jgi:hypothetical protein